MGWGEFLHSSHIHFDAREYHCIHNATCTCTTDDQCPSNLHAPTLASNTVTFDLYLVNFECDAGSWDDDVLNGLHVEKHPLIVWTVGACISEEHPREAVHEVVTAT